MVQLKDAVSRARAYLTDFFSMNSVKELQLEGVELSEDEKYWLVTFSYFGPEELSDAEPSFGKPFYKTYKSVKIKASDGSLVGLKNGLLSTGVL